MTFYSSISAYYDEIFPVDAAEMAFTKKQLAARKAVLDIGCGTGNKTIHLATPERKILGIDGDPAMIEEAQKHHTAPNVHYKVLNMRELGMEFCPESFDALLCLGNTLVHLPGQDEIAKCLGEMAGILKPGGMAVIQILNYDRVLDKEAHELPLLETANIRFERRYDINSCEMRFITRLTVKASGQEFNNSIPLYPLRKRELDAMLGEAGFLEAEHYGSYQGSPLTEDSLPLIAVARKG